MTEKHRIWYWTVLLLIMIYGDMKVALHGKGLLIFLDLIPFIIICIMLNSMVLRMRILSDKIKMKDKILIELKDTIDKELKKR